MKYNNDIIHIILKYARIIVVCLAGSFTNDAFWNKINVDCYWWMNALGMALFYIMFYIIIVIIPDEIIKSIKKRNEK